MNGNCHLAELEDSSGELVPATPARVCDVDRALNIRRDELPDLLGEIDREGGGENLIAHHRHFAALAAEPQHSLDEIPAFARAAGQAVQARGPNDQMIVA